MFSVPGWKKLIESPKFSPEKAPEEAVTKALASLPWLVKMDFALNRDAARMPRLFLTPDSHGRDKTDLVLDYYSVGYHVAAKHWRGPFPAFREAYCQFWETHLMHLPGDLAKDVLHAMAGRKSEASSQVYDEIRLMESYFSVAGSPPAAKPTSGKAQYHFLLSDLVGRFLTHGPVEKPSQMQDIQSCGDLSSPVRDNAQRILSHAVNMQEGSFFRELAQNTMDEITRRDVPEKYRCISINISPVFENETGWAEVEYHDNIGMSFPEVVNFLLTPGNTSKSKTSHALLGRFGQGFFTCLRQADQVWIETVQNSPNKREKLIRCVLLPKRDGDRVVDAACSMDIHPFFRLRNFSRGTRFVLRLPSSTPMVRAAQLHREAAWQLRFVPANTLRIHLNGRLVNEPMKMLAETRTNQGQFKILAPHKAILFQPGRWGDHRHPGRVVCGCPIP